MAKSTVLVRENLASRLARDILGRISREEIAAEGRLPTEAEIAQHYGVSRTVVREAISRLRADGIVTARPRAGTFVTPTAWNRPFRIDIEKSDPVFALMHILELRIAFEVEAARLAAVRRSEEDLAALRSCLDLMARDVAGEESGVDADVGFHRHLALAAQNPLFSDFFEFIHPHLRQEVRLARRNTARLSQRRAAGLWLGVQEEHAAVLSAVEAANPAKAAAAVRSHLRNTAKRLQRLRQEGVAAS